MAAAVVSVVNLKGGVGKSTITMMLGEFLTFQKGRNVLLIDMDAQANLSYCMVPEDQIQRQEREGRTTYHLFRAVLDGQQSNVANFITQPPLVVSNTARALVHRHEAVLHMVVSTPSVAELDEELLGLWRDNKPLPKGLRQALANSLAPAKQKYDYVLIDCPPGLSLFSSTALCASTSFISPIIPEPLSLQGVQLVKKRAGELNQRGDAKVQFAGAVLNIVKHYRSTHQRTSEWLYSTTQGADLYKPFAYWLPDNERLRRLGEFDPDLEGPWALGMNQKFPTLYHKYSLSYSLSNPIGGSLSRKDVEGPKYKLDERISHFVEEFEEKCGKTP